MNDQNPADLLRSAAGRVRIGAPEIACARLAWAISQWLAREARSHEATVTAAVQVFGDDEAAREAWIAKQTNDEALAVARTLLGGDQ
jgi:hypothetical protein